MQAPALSLCPACGQPRLEHEPCLHCARGLETAPADGEPPPADGEPPPATHSPAPS